MSYGYKFTVHIVLVFCAFVAAYALRRGLWIDWWLTNPEAIPVLVWAGMYAVVAGFFEAIFRTERTAWRFSSVADVARLAQTTGLTALAFLAVIFLSNRAISLPRSTLVLSWLLSLFGLVGIRLAWRVTTDRRLVRSLFFMPLRRRRSDARPLVLVGPLQLAETYLRRYAGGYDQEYQPLSIVASTSNLIGQLVFGVPVAGTLKDLEVIVERVSHDPEEAKALLFLDDPILKLGLTAEQIGRLRADGWTLLRQPNLAEIQQGGGGLREMRLEEFLPRAPISLNASPVKTLVNGRRVLVTGAGGSIGSEICRQLAGLGCAHLTMIDHSEFLLFEIDREIAGLGHDGTRRAVLCNVRDADRVKRVFEEEKPEIVFHAAALKHVTLVEENPCEGVLTNVKGTLHVIEAAKAVSARQMVLISTDKAVDPTNLMGSTKRIAESLLPHGRQGTRFCAVRFGNVLGSAGSVVPIFKRQIEAGGPVTVTHEDVERYFMTIPEAVQLVLHATALSHASPASTPRKFVLEMGSPVKIIDLARRMIEISGLRVDDDIAIEITGLKPGEKLSESLVDDNEDVRPCVEHISEISGKSDLSPATINLGALIAAAERDDRERAIAEIRQAVECIRASSGSTARATHAA